MQKKSRGGSECRLGGCEPRVIEVFVKLRKKMSGSSRGPVGVGVRSVVWWRMGGNDVNQELKLL